MLVLQETRILNDLQCHEVQSYTKSLHEKLMIDSKCLLDLCLQDDIRSFLELRVLKAV